MKDFDEWNEIKKRTEDSKRAPVKVGEIYWCKLGLNIGVEQDGKDAEFQRPILVLKKFSHQIILGVPLTTQIHKGDWYFDLSIFEYPSQAILNQAKPIDTKRLLSSMGQISDIELEKVIDAYCLLIKTK